jgi:glutamate-1-semialdehyde 2,1-aminomutase
MPGGTQLLSKRPEMLLPDQWPSYYTSAAGTRVHDLDGNEYIDMSFSGIGACVLGYADLDVDTAVRDAISQGTMTTLNCPEEVELAELLLDLHPWAEMVRYSRTGGEAMAMAVRIARAATGRDKIAFCGYHGWHDWYLATNLSDSAGLEGHLLPGLDPAGVPRGLHGSVIPFRYGAIAELEWIVASHGDELAAIVMEPVRSAHPPAGFLERVRELAHRQHVVLVFDEITSGWRLTTGGAHLVYGVVPDIAVFAKGMSNGYPMAAIIGTAAAMDAAQYSFISSTYWTERIGPTAAIAAIMKHQQQRVPVHLDHIGTLVQQGWQTLANRYGLALTTGGITPLSKFTLRYPNSQAIRTLFTQLMLERGFLATNALYVMYAHTNEDVERYLHAVDETFGILAQSIQQDTVEAMLKGPVAHSGFQRLT